MVGDVGRRVRRLGVVAAVALALSGCWTQVGFGPERQRHNPLEQTITAGNVATLTEVWSEEYAGSLSEPIAVGGRVFFTRTDAEARTVDVHAVEEGTGAELWRRTLLTASGSPWLGNPVVFSEGELWVSYAGPDGVAVLRLDPATGATNATVSTGEIVGTQVVATGEIVAYSDLDGLVVRDRASGTLLWRFRPSTQPGIPSGPRLVAIDGGRIYASFGRELYAFSTAGCGAATCPPLWQRTGTTDPVINALAVGPGGRVVTTTAFDWIENPGRPPAPANSLVVAYEGRTGEVAWSGSVVSATGGLAIDGDAVHVTTEEVADIRGPAGATLGSRRVVAFPAAGCDASPCGSTWQTEPLPAEPTEPLVAGGVVYTSVGDELRAYDAAGCGAATCEALAGFPGAGAPRSLALGRLYLTSPTGSGSTRLTAMAPG